MTLDLSDSVLHASTPRGLPTRIIASFRGPYSTHCKSCEKTSFWTKFFALWRRTCLVVGGHRHGSHTMAGVGHNHSFPHMSNLAYPMDIVVTVLVSLDLGIPSTCRDCVSPNRYFFRDRDSHVSNSYTKRLARDPS